MDNKTALITGFTGQDAPYLAKLLLDKGYRVIGLVRRVSHPSLSFVEEMGLRDVILIESDLTDQSSIDRIVVKYQPDEIYNLAAQSHVKTSFDQPELTSDVTGLGVLRILESIRNHSPKSKFYQASSSEMFGDVVGQAAQNEDTVLRPVSPYAVAKVFGHHMVRVYRESYGIFACSGMLFNHESPRRGDRFVTKKITEYVAKFHKMALPRMPNGSQEPLSLGYLDSYRDWGSAKDYVLGMWLMLQQDEPEDFVLATGQVNSVRDFCAAAFKRINIDIEWRKGGLDETGVQVLYPGGTLHDERVIVNINPEFYRPSEVPYLLGDASKAKRILGWQPEMDFQQLVDWMVDYDLERF